MKAFYSKLATIIKKADKAHLEIVCFVVVLIILLPILILGRGAVFPVLDQLDETILNYVFPARYSGAHTFEQMMCGVPSTSLKPFAPGFVVLFKIFPVFPAFVIMYAIVVLVAGIGTYMCVKRLTDSSIMALLAGAVFALLPFRNIYGVSISGTPWLIACVLYLHDAMNQKEYVHRKKRYTKLVLPVLGISFYAVTSSLVLVGYAAIIVLGLFYLAKLTAKRKSERAILVAILTLGLIYAVLNIDLISQLFFGGEFVSHREEYVVNGFNFFGTFKGVMIHGMQHYESFHKYIFIPALVALPVAIYDIYKKEKLGKIYLATVAALIVTGLLYALFASDFMADVRNSIGGMIKTFQFQRFFWLLPGEWYVLLGVSLGLIWKLMRDKLPLCGLLAVFALYLPTLLYVGKNPDCIFYQNINQINNGSDITGYISWEALYAENQMEAIRSDIKAAYGMEENQYRIANLALSPVPALMSGFYTVDGYSNDYPLEYKKKFGAIIEKELAKNQLCSDYFYDWGNRCYLFYSEFGGAYMIPGNTDAVITGMEFDLDGLRELNCRFIFSGCEIGDCEAQGISLFNVYEDEKSFWKIWVYEL